jgi:hypothetical protein
MSLNEADFVQVLQVLLQSPASPMETFWHLGEAMPEFDDLP